jgi:hypothetical protein
MKKLFALLVLVCFASQMFGQASGSTVTFLPNQNYKVVTIAAGDTVSGVGVKYWDFAVNRTKLYYFAFATELDTTLIHARTAGNRVLCQVYGAIDASGAYRQIGSNIFYNINAGTNADSTLLLSDVSTGVLYRFLRVKFTGVVASKCATVKSLALRIADK